MTALGDLPLRRRQQDAPDAASPVLLGHPEILDPIVVRDDDADDPPVDLGEQAASPVAGTVPRRRRKQIAVDLTHDGAHELLDARLVGLASRPDDDAGRQWSGRRQLAAFGPLRRSCAAAPKRRST